MDKIFLITLFMSLLILTESGYKAGSGSGRRRGRNRTRYRRSYAWDGFDYKIDEDVLEELMDERII